MIVGCGWQIPGKCGLLYIIGLYWGDLILHAQGIFDLACIENLVYFSVAGRFGSVISVWANLHYSVERETWLNGTHTKPWYDESFVEDFAMRKACEFAASSRIGAGHSIV